MATLVDTNVILDLLIGDPLWADWSQRQLDAATARGALLINAIVYAELASRFEMMEHLDATIAEANLIIETIPRSSLFLAGKAYRRYRAAGGSKTGVLPDLFIGAHAAVLGVPLLTRDVTRYRSYFPTVELIAPDTLS